MIFSIIITILALGAMVCIHELGHMLAAKSFGVLVREFSIGMGPKLFSVKPGETAYSLRLLPIGGYVQMEGEGYEEGESAEPVDPQRSFRYLPAWKRFIILVAGATLNVLLGLTLFTIINLNTYVHPPVVTSAAEGYEAATVFREGDEILRIDGTRIHSFQDVTMKLAELNDRDRVDVVVRREGEKLTLSAPLYEDNGGKKLMIMFGEVIYDPGLFTSVRYAAYDTVYVVKAVVGAVGDLLTGRQAVDSLSGPVEIVAVVDDVASTDSPYTWLTLLALFALITVNLGVFNLLPIPALDGGQILFLIIEKIIGREIKPSVVATVNAIFFSLLMLLAVYVTVGDVRGLIG